jgi:transcriptional regulator with XRE-family HTH domain
MEKEQKQVNKKASNKPNKSAGKRRGSKAKYEYWLTKDGLLLIEAWCRDGLVDEQIAKNIGISRSTLNEWKSKYSVISDILKKSKEIVDIEVENALLKRAKGYEFDEVKEEYENTENGQQKLIRRTVIKKEVVADTTAQIFWLKNRRPERWQNNDKIIVQQEKTNTVLEDLINQTKRPVAEELDDLGDDV